MSFRNHMLSFVSGADIHRGRAVKMQADGTVVEITSINDLVVGWAVSDAISGSLVGIQTIFDGTVTVEVVPNSALYAGKELTLNADGRMKVWGVTDNDVSAHMGYLITRMTSAADGVYAEALMLRQLNKWDRPAA